MPRYLTVSANVRDSLSQVSEEHDCLNRLPTRITTDLETLKRLSRYETSSEVSYLDILHHKCDRILGVAPEIRSYAGCIGRTRH